MLGQQRERNARFQRRQQRREVQEAIAEARRTPTPPVQDEPEGPIAVVFQPLCHERSWYSFFFFFFLFFYRISAASGRFFYCLSADLSAFLLFERCLVRCIVLG